MSETMWVWLGAGLGCLIGLAGGVFGTWCSVRNTRTPAERAVMVRYSVVCWLLVATLLAGLLLIPQPYNWLMWVPYPFALAYIINRANAEQARLRAAGPAR